MPIFSVIIPTYNSEKYIETTINSVLDQTFKDFELIIVDDGSQDSTRELLDTYKNIDERIQVILSKNSGGPATPTNIGIGLARGAFITFLDHDDSWKKTKLEILFREFKNNPHVGFILSNVETYSEDDSSTQVSTTKIRNNKASTDTLLSGKYFNTFSMISIRQEVLSRIGALDVNLLIFTDYDIITRLVSFNVQHIFLAEPLVTYRIHAHNTSALPTSAKRRAEDLERILTKYSKTFPKNNKSFSAVHHAIGSLYLYLGNVSKARNHYRTAIKLYPRNLFMYIRYLFTYLGDKPYRILTSLKRKAFRKVS